MSVIHVTSKSSFDQVVAEMDRRGSVIEQLEARIRALEAIPQGAIDALRNNQRQLDMDGCEVGVSRQAIDEVLTGLDAALASLAPQVAPANPVAGEPMANLRLILARLGELNRDDEAGIRIVLANVIDTLANPAQVTDAMVAEAAKSLGHEGVYISYETIRRALTAAIGADSAEPSLLDRERAAMDVTQRRAIEAESIADAVLSWMVKYDLLDVDNEYHASDVLAVLNDLAPSAAIGAGGQAVAVKALEWSDEGWCWQAFPEIGEYRVEDQGLNWNVDRFWVSYRGEILGKFADSDDALAAAQADYERRIMSTLSHPHPAYERVVEALRMAHSFIAREYRDEKSLALEGEFVSKEARPVFRALSDALSAKEGQS